MLHCRFAAQRFFNLICPLSLLAIGPFFVAGCAGGGSQTPPATITITTSSLPDGQVGSPYSATLAATGGSTPYTWTLTGGTLPTGLSLNASTGVISGSPSQSLASAALTFKVTDSGNPPLTQSVNLTLTIASPPGVSVQLSPKRGGTTATQLLPLAATVTNDVGAAGVSWTVSAGASLSSQTPAVASFSASAAGVYTVTATSKADSTKSASATIGVTDLAGVTTYHNNLSRDGTNTQEYALTTANVTSSTFGKLFGCAIDAPAYAQPLWIANLSVNGAMHNVVYVATQHDTLYAFDADNPSCVNVWGVAKSLLPSGETYLSSGDVSTGDIAPDIGITGTPVIDLTTKTLYLVTKSKDTGTSCTPSSSCHQRLHALNLLNGNEIFGGPVSIDTSITVPGTGDGSSNGTLAFNPLTENQRPGLALVNGVVYISWASHGDNDPYHGWVIGYTANNLAAGPAAIWNSTPNSVNGFPQSRGGIWMAGGAPAADSSNNLYLLTGNGSFDASTGGSNYGDSTVKLSTPTLQITDYFTPSDQASLNSADNDHGSGGAAILIDQPSGPVSHLIIGGGKAGNLFLLNRDNLGGYNSNGNTVVQTLSLGNGIYGTSAFWNNFLYIAGNGGPLVQFAFNTGTGQFAAAPVHASPGPTIFQFPGSTPSVSSTGTSANGIVWTLDNGNYGPPGPNSAPTVLHAYDASNISTELWNSAQAAGKAAGNAVKFSVPTIANGKAYVGTRTEISVFGLLPN